MDLNYQFYTGSKKVSANHTDHQRGKKKKSKMTQIELTLYHEKKKKISLKMWK